MSPAVYATRAAQRRLAGSGWSILSRDVWRDVVHEASDRLADAMSAGDDVAMAALVDDLAAEWLRRINRAVPQFVEAAAPGAHGAH